MSILLYFLFQIENGKENTYSQFGSILEKNPNKLNKC